MYFISPTARVFENLDKLILGLGTRQLIVSRADRTAYIDILELAKGGCRESDLQALLQGSSEYERAFENLKSAGVIAKSSGTDLEVEDIRFKTTLYLESLKGYTAQTAQKIQNTTVLILGCGGIGNHLAYSLSSFGVKELIFVDGDHIEASNLNRQFLFSPDDLGKNKAEVIHERIRKLRPDLKLTNKVTSVGREELEGLIQNIEGPAIAVISADSDGILRELVPVLVRGRIPFLNVGYLNDISVIGPFWTSNSDSCPCCFNSLVANNSGSERELEVYCKDYEAPSMMVNNSFAGAMAVSDMINFWLGGADQVVSTNRRIGISNSTFELLEVPVEKDEACCACSIASRSYGA